MRYPDALYFESVSVTVYLPSVFDTGSIVPALVVATPSSTSDTAIVTSKDPDVSVLLLLVVSAVNQAYVIEQSATRHSKILTTDMIRLCENAFSVIFSSLHSKKFFKSFPPLAYLYELVFQQSKDTSRILLCPLIAAYPSRGGIGGLRLKFRN